jgi:hypothetical protein
VGSVQAAIDCCWVDVEGPGDVADGSTLLDQAADEILLVGSELSRAVRVSGIMQRASCTLYEVGLKVWAQHAVIT